MVTIGVLAVLMAVFWAVYFFTREEKKVNLSPVNSPAIEKKIEKIPEPVFQITDEFKESISILENTNDSIFITGKAGTGKSSLLRHFIKATNKKFVIVAPTGIAALNVGGQTIHSFFKFGIDRLNPNTYKIDYVRANLFQQLDMMIIDEVSMVRSDLMDAVDAALRKNRNRLDEPFGGVQMVFIGDLFQLPPVVPPEEKDWIFEKYAGQYFFDAPVFRTYRYKFQELTKVFRQSEDQESFKALLNNVRDGSVSFQDMVLLNGRHKQNTAEHKDAIFLTARRNTAYMLNQQQLTKIAAEQYEYRSSLSGKYEYLIENKTEEDADDALPAPYILKLKKGAQIMMLRNDPSRRWVNGSIGKVVKINKDGFSVLIDTVEYEVEKETWKEVEYFFNQEKNEIEEIVKAQFIQYPVRLAYAITIHKSQGKTFDKITVDIGAGAFASGQIYVALSRATTLKGVVLNNPINNHDIIIDERIKEYYLNPSTVPRPNIYENTQSINYTLNVALTTGQNIIIEYQDFNGDRSERTISNIQKSAEYGDSYITGYCHYRNADRTFKMDRISKARIVS